MFFVTQQGHIDVVKCLLGGGANVNLASKDGATPLHVASRVCECHRAVVEACLIVCCGTGRAHRCCGTPSERWSAN